MEITKTEISKRIVKGENNKWVTKKCTENTRWAGEAPAEYIYNQKIDNIIAEIFVADVYPEDQAAGKKHIVAIILKELQKKGEGIMENENEILDYLMKNEIATEDEINLITAINGYNVETLNNIIYARTGYWDVKQLEAGKRRIKN